MIVDGPPLVGQVVSEATKAQIRKAMAETLGATPGVQGASVTSAKTLWELMGAGERWKWYWFNRLFAKEGARWRMALLLKHSQDVELWRQDNPDEEECPFRFELPPYLESDPKSILKIDTTFNLTQPLEYIELTLTV